MENRRTPNESYGLHAQSVNSNADMHRMQSMGSEWYKQDTQSYYDVKYGHDEVGVNNFEIPMAHPGRHEMPESQSNWSNTMETSYHELPTRPNKPMHLNYGTPNVGRPNYASTPGQCNAKHVAYEPSRNSPSQGRQYRKHKEPMRFNGKTDWNDYYSHLMAIAEWNGWNIEECGLQLALSLVDEAREVFSSLHPSERRNFHTLKRALQQRFDPEGRETTYSFELMKSYKTRGGRGHIRVCIEEIST